jgi:hypothetical protein
MSIRKKQAEAIIGALMTDLAAAGELDALAVVRRASMPMNIRLAQGETQANVNSLMAQISKDISSIDSMITAAAATGAPTSNVHNARKNINALKSLFEGREFETALAQAQRMASDAFIEGEAFGTSLFATWGGGSEVDIELIFDEEFPATERPRTEAYKKIINRVLTNLRHITDSQGAVSGEPQSASSDATRASAIAEYRKVAEEATAILKTLSEPQKGEKSTALRNSPDWKEWIKAWGEIGEHDSSKLSLSQIKNATTKGRSALSVLNN